VIAYCNEQHCSVLVISHTHTLNYVKMVNNVDVSLPS